MYATRRRRPVRQSTPDTEEDIAYKLLGGSTAPSAPTDSGDTPQSHHTPLDTWMQDLALLTWRIPRRQLRFGDAASRGAFGIVFRGWLDDQLVAIKVLAPDRCHDMTEIEKFAREAQFLSVLQHERIVRFMGVAWNAPSDLCIITEFVTGGDLRGLLQRYLCEGQPQGFNAAKIKIALHIAHALTYLHSLDAPVVHRDLKSKNVLLTDSGDAKLTDFGVAREWDGDCATMTAGVGSLLWMAPEVMQGERYDEKADIFSFGVVLSELDSNELPYTHTSAPRRLSSSSSPSSSAAGDAADHDRRLPEAAICQLVSLGQLSVAFSSHVLPELVALGMACVSLDPTQRPTACEVLGTLHRMWMDAGGE
ncbi:hypothetical protein PINS_up018550 [Pythium insidiosum]|nr:hypothetical protein PINS_up018550 [Pythium insidiosum]